MNLRPRTTTNYATSSTGIDAHVHTGPAGRVVNMQAGLLARRKECRIACWNVRTLKAPETQALTIHTLSQYNIDVACLSEVRLADSGHHIIKVPAASASYHLYHSGVTDNSGRHGVALALSDAANAALLLWKPISPQTCTYPSERGINQHLRHCYICPHP